jgi:catalase-peroxidase
LFKYEWALNRSPTGANIWNPVDAAQEDMAPEVDGSANKLTLMMTTADMAMIKDPEYLKVSEKFHKDPELLKEAFARAWFKLLHRDMGPKELYLGPEVPEEDLIWQDPIPQGQSDYDVDAVREALKASGLSQQEMIETAWASGSTFRGSDMRGGTNGARLRLEPQKKLGRQQTRATFKSAEYFGSYCEKSQFKFGRCHSFGRGCCNRSCKWPERSICGRSWRCE